MPPGIRYFECPARTCARHKTPIDVKSIVKPGSNQVSCSKCERVFNVTSQFSCCAVSLKFICATERLMSIQSFKI